MNIWRDYGLSIVLFLLFLSSWVGQSYFQWNEFVSTQEEHGQTPQVADFINEFGTSTLENWQSEFLQLLTFVVLTSFLIHRGSHESKDSDEEMKAMLIRIENKLSTSKKASAKRR
jgi:hypothetical protein